MGCSNTCLPAAWRRTGAPVCSPTGRVAYKQQLGSAPICNGYSVTVCDEDIASANGSLSYHRVVSGELWDAQTPASRPRGGAQGLRCVLQLDVSPTSHNLGGGRFATVIPSRCGMRTSASANGSLPYHHVVSGIRHPHPGVLIELVETVCVRRTASDLTGRIRMRSRGGVGA